MNASGRRLTNEQLAQTLATADYVTDEVLFSTCRFTAVGGVIGVSADPGLQLFNYNAGDQGVAGFAAAIAMNGYMTNSWFKGVLSTSELIRINGIRIQHYALITDGNVDAGITADPTPAMFLESLRSIVHSIEIGSGFKRVIGSSGEWPAGEGLHMTFPVNIVAGAAGQTSGQFAASNGVPDFRASRPLLNPYIVQGGIPFKWSVSNTRPLAWGTAANILDVRVMLDITRYTGLSGIAGA